MIRTVFALIFIIPFTIILGLGAVLFGIINPYLEINNKIGRLWCRGILWVAGVELAIEGLEKIDFHQTYIFVGNHQSHFDVPAIFSVLPMTVRFIAKKELFKIPFFGWGMTAVGMLKIDRVHQQHAHETMNRAVEVMRGGVSVVVFPEGTRSQDGSIGNFKKGGFVIAIKGNFPVVPVSISGSRFILQKHTLRLRPGRIKVKFCDPIDTSGYDYEHRNDLAEKTRQIIIQHFDIHYNERET